MAGLFCGMAMSPDRERGVRLRKVILCIIVGVVALFAAAIVFVTVSPDYDARIVRSESMKPALEIGDVVVTGPVSTIEQVKPGMIISFLRGTEVVAHRVVSVSEEGIVTRGDAVEDVDRWLVPFSDVKGRYLLRVPYLGFIAKFIRTPLGWGLVVILPAALLIMMIVWGMFRASPAKNGAPSRRAAPTKRRAGKRSPSARADLRRVRRQGAGHV